MTYQIIVDHENRCWHLATLEGQRIDNSGQCGLDNVFSRALMQLDYGDSLQIRWFDALGVQL